MSIKPEPQHIVNAGQPFVVMLTSDQVFESGTMRVLVNGTRRAFTLFAGVQPAEEQPVNVFGVVAESVQAGWGSALDVESVLTVEVDLETSEPRTILP